MPPQQSLWSHILWNSSKRLYHLILDGTIDVKDKIIYELGAGAAIPSIASVRCGACHVVVSEVPNQMLQENIRFNLEQNLTKEQLLNTEIHGHYWGEKMPSQKYDLIYQCDLIFNHNEHGNLIKEIQQCLKPTGECHVLFTHHRPQYKEKDLRFFKLCEKSGLEIEIKDTIKMERMFPEDDEYYEVEIRELVHWYVVRHKQ